MKFTIKKTGKVIQAIPCATGWKDIETFNDYTWDDLEPFREAKSAVTTGVVHGIGMRVNIGVSVDEWSTKSLG